MKQLGRYRTIDHYVLIALVVLAIPVTILAPLNFFGSILAFFGLPAAYLSYRNPAVIRKAALGGFIIGVLLGFPFDFVAEFNHAWGWNTTFTLPVEFFGVVSLDIMVWYFLWAYLVIAYYEHFIDGVRSKISSKAVMVAAAGVLLTILVIFLFNTAPELLVLQYPYFVLGMITIALAYLVLRQAPHLFPKVVRGVPFFVLLYLSYEVSALYAGVWNFPGAYIGTIGVLDVRFPIEELFIWIVASSAVVATYYEFCIDDER